MKQRAPAGNTVSCNDAQQQIDQFVSQVAAGETVLRRMRQPFKDVDPERIERDVSALIEEVRRELRGQPAPLDER